MNDTLYRSIPHPPDTEDRTVLHIPDPDELQRLALADRLSLRIGLWLLQRAQRPQKVRRFAPAPEDALYLDRFRHRGDQSLALLTFDLQRQLR